MAPKRSAKLWMGVWGLVAFALLSLGVMQTTLSNQIRHTVSLAIAPLVQVVQAPAHYVTSTWPQIQQYFAVHSENERLRAQVTALEGWYYQAQQLDVENQALKQAVFMPEVDQYSQGVARVMMHHKTAFSHALSLRVTHDTPITNGAPVLSGPYVLGRVIGEKQDLATVLLLTDMQSKVPVRSYGQGVQAIAQGNGTNILMLTAMHNEQEALALTEGELVTTSGMGGLFPADLPVGQVVKLDDGSWGVQISADLTKLDYVRWLYQDQASAPVVAEKAVPEAAPMVTAAKPAVTP